MTERKLTCKAHQDIPRLPSVGEKQKKYGDRQDIVVGNQWKAKQSRAEARKK
jgi:hypothetical protein